MSVSDGVVSALGVLGKVIGTGMIEGAKLGYQFSKGTKNIAKETIKGAAKGGLIISKTILGKE